MSPALESVDVRILDEVIERLEEIKSANNVYYSDPRRVYRLYGNALEVEEVPCLIVTPQMSPSSHDCPNGCERMDLKIAITAVTDPETGGALHGDFAEVDRDVRRMCADIRKALLADIQRAGLALDTIIVSTDIFEAVESQPVAAAEVVVSIPFRYLTADPTQAQ